MISILMCTYNRAYCVEHSINSVLNQTYEDFEFIIVDDGSTDATEELIRTYTDSRIKYIKMERNSYYCHAANCGLAHCNGDYVAFMNSDDEWLPDKLQKQVEFMEKNTEYGACFTAVALIDKEGRDITDECRKMAIVFDARYRSQKEYLQAFLYRGNTLCHPSAFIRKSILDKTGGFNLMYCQLADLDLWIRIVTLAPIHVLDERLTCFRWDITKNDQISNGTRDTAIRTFNEQMMIRRDLIERLSDEQFIEIFGDKFKNKDSRSHLEIEFEKAFLLSECVGEIPELKILGIHKLEQVLRMPGAVDTLNSHFGMRIHEVYEWTKAHMYYNPWLIGEYDEKIHKLNVEKAKLIIKQDQEIRQLRAEYENSNSWKITAPLRNVIKKRQKGEK